MLPPLQSPPSHAASPCIHLAALTSHLCTVARESLLHVSQNHASLLRKPPKSPRSLGAQASPSPTPGTGISHQRAALILPHTALYCPCSLCSSHMGLSCLRNFEWAGPLPGMLSPHRTTWLQLSFPKGPYSKVTVSKNTFLALFI